MNYGLYMSAAGLMTNLHKQDVVANNLANVNTTGFKRSLAEFQQRDPEAREGNLGPDMAHKLLDNLGGGVYAAPSRLDITGGSVIKTNQMLDLAIEGQGFFTVRDGQSIRLSRDGRLAIREGILVTSVGGRPVLSAAGAPIPLDSSKPFTVDPTGDVRQDEGSVGRIRLVAISDSSQLSAMGGGLYAVPPKSLENTAPASGVIIQRALEQSNVDPVKEMISMIETTRAVNFTSQMIRAHDQTMDRAVNVLGKVS